jgi:hypothetical protein
MPANRLREHYPADGAHRLERSEGYDVVVNATPLGGSPRSTSWTTRIGQDVVGEVVS